MDFRHLEYFVEIAKEKNITKAAENLFVSQPAVNQYLLKLEKELGTQLFIRNRRTLELTQAGQIYLKGCEKALMLKQDIYNEIHDLAESRAGSLTVGLTHTRGLIMFTTIYPKMKSLFPGVSITPVEMQAMQQQKAIALGEIDLGFLVLPDILLDTKHYVDLGEEEILLLMPVDNPICQEALRNPQWVGADQKRSPLPVLDIRCLKDMPFALTRQGSSFRTACDGIFQKADFLPHILLETSSTAHVAQLTQAGLCCGLIPYYYADLQNPRYKCFRLSSFPTWHLYITYREDYFLTSAARRFIELSQIYWKDIQLMPGSEP